jgi:hypothetical protein
VTTTSVSRKRGLGGRRRDHVFLNVPYDPSYEGVFVALIVAVTAARLVPHCTLEVPSVRDRRERIFGLIEQCGTSVHDISIPDRLNMPFELGFAFAVERYRGRGTRGAHEILVLNRDGLEAMRRLSDLNGVDVYGHDLDDRRAAAIVFGQLRETGGLLPVRQLERAVDRVRAATARIVKRHRTKELYELGTFDAVRYAAVKECTELGLV